MPCPAHIQPPHPQQQRFPIRHGQCHGIPAAVVERFGGVFAQFKEEPTRPVGHFADYSETYAGGLNVVEGAYAVGAEDAFIPGIISLALEIGWCGCCFWLDHCCADLPGQGE